MRNTSEQLRVIEGFRQYHAEWLRKSNVEFRRLAFGWNRRFEFEWGLNDLAEFPPQDDARLTPPSS